MKFITGDQLKNASTVLSITPATSPHMDFGLKLYRDPATTGKGLAAASSKSMARAQASTPEAAVAWAWAESAITQKKK